MAHASRTEVWDVPVDICYKVITDYASYPQFVEGVSALDVLSQDETGANVQYHLNIIKKFKFIIKLVHRPPHLVSWGLESGELFKKNDGSWEFKDRGNQKTEVTYSLDVEIKSFFPKSIAKALTSIQLPGMMKSFHQRAIERYRKDR